MYAALQVRFMGVPNDKSPGSNLLFVFVEYMNFFINQIVIIEELEFGVLSLIKLLQWRPVQEINRNSHFINRNSHLKELNAFLIQRP